VATALAHIAGMLVADQTASLRRHDPDQVLRVASAQGEALSKLLTPLAVVQMFEIECPVQSGPFGCTSASFPHQRETTIIQGHTAP